MLVYFFIALFATVIGSTAGMGGGFIIKPLIDLISDYNIATISILSSITVLSMSVVSTIKQIENGFKISKNVVYSTIGAIVGGIVGSLVFSFLKDSMDEGFVTVIQSIVLIVLLIFCLAYEKFKIRKKKTGIAVMVFGFFLGLVSSFIGIGGGPINVAVLCIFLGLELRVAARISVFIVLFSQMTGLITKGINGMFLQVEDYRVLLVMIPTAIIGGLIGSSLNIKLSDKAIRTTYMASVIIVIFICIVNIYKIVMI